MERQHTELTRRLQSSESNSKQAIEKATQKMQAKIKELEAYKKESLIKLESVERLEMILETKKTTISELEISINEWQTRLIKKEQELQEVKSKHS